ncbi:phosphotransferase [Streptomyces sp. UG1]|uniref:phosphotransferase n=1 Tax=Streptomyces sp. UG1 TaxID=3417652 RepID=UPI003CFA20C8
MGRLLGTGRTADVYEIDEAWVLRRNREGYGDALAEGAVMAHARAHGYPAPRVRLADSSRTELVMERLPGPTMLGALTGGTLGPDEAGGILAHLILAQAAVVAEPVAEAARSILTSLLADPSDLTEAGLTEALRRRAVNPTMTPREIELLGDTEALIRTLMR